MRGGERNGGDARTRVLLVDDSKPFLERAGRVLGPFFNLQRHNSWMIAEEHIDEFDPGVVMVDYVLGQYDKFRTGVKVMEDLKRDGRGRVLVLVSERFTNEAVADANTLCIDLILSKFVSDETMIASLTRTIERCRGGGPGSDPGIGADPERTLPEGWLDMPYKAARHEARKLYLDRRMRRARGVVVHAAENSGILREAFFRELRKHGLGLEDYRDE